MIASINPAALPALRIAGLLFIVINVLAGVYLYRNWSRLFGPDPSVDDDIKAVRYLRVMVIAIPLLILTFRLVEVWIGFWTD